jgi:hypothetical protein
VEFNCSLALSERPLLNRRPITLITFPSNTQIEAPGSPYRSRSVAIGTSEMKEEFEQQDPSKKLKME